MKHIAIIIVFMYILNGCTRKEEKADAYGTFEATEVIISAETSGRIMKFDVTEGSEVEMGTSIALIDTTMFHLQKLEADAGMQAIGTRTIAVNAQNEILAQQIENVKVNLARIENMLKDDAATQKQYDDLAGQISVLHKQIAANNTQKASIAAELAVIESKKATLNKQIDRSWVKSPLTGTVVARYAEEGEMITTGRPLVKIADLSVIRLKVYVSGAQLSDLRIGGTCTVRVDHGEKGYKAFPGTIAYIADKAEFTPKIIQTKEERVALVYAVTIDVRNDGTMKPGMPGEAIF